MLKEVELRESFAERSPKSAQVRGGGVDTQSGWEPLVLQVVRDGGGRVVDDAEVGSTAKRVVVVAVVVVVGGCSCRCFKRKSLTMHRSCKRTRRLAARYGDARLC